jgi:serine/threonine protein kinase
VKLGNIFLAKPDESDIFNQYEPKLGDFDSAKFADAGSQDDPHDAAFDVYKLGAAMHLLCVGKHPKAPFNVYQDLVRIGLAEQPEGAPLPPVEYRGSEVYYKVSVPVNTPNEKLAELGIDPGEGGYSDALEAILKCALNVNKTDRITAVELHRRTTMFYRYASGIAMEQEPESVADFQAKFALAAKEANWLEVMMLHELDSALDDPMDIDQDDEPEEVRPRQVRFKLPNDNRLKAPGDSETSED